MASAGSKGKFKGNCQRDVQTAFVAGAGGNPNDVEPPEFYEAEMPLWDPVANVQISGIVIVSDSL